MNIILDRQDDMKKYLSAIIMLVVLCGLAGAGRAKISHEEKDLGFPVAASAEHEPLRAEIVSDRPASFTFDLQQFANIGVSENAESYVIYTASMLPPSCGDFTGQDLTYWEPSKYKRTFDLRGHKDVIKALESYGCIIVKSNQSHG